jgi:hypothetical protein
MTFYDRTQIVFYRTQVLRKRYEAVSESTTIIIS